MKNLVSIERLKFILEYHSDGYFIRKSKVNRNTIIGSKAGYIRDNGYVVVRVDNVDYLEHRLVWFYMTGEWPKENIDHIDLNKTNNRFDNLREASPTENNFNCVARKTSKSGFKGIRLFKGKYRVRITINNKEIYIGSFLSLEEAIAARNAKGLEIGGVYYRPDNI